METIYLDNAATTSIDKEVIDIMVQSMLHNNGNPSSTHQFGRKAKSSVETARKNITVNAIAPGYIDTEILADASEDFLKGLITKIPVGRLGTVEEISRIVTFLASDDAGFVTGSTITANGGQYFI